MSQSIHNDTVITRTADVVAADMDGDTVMLSIASGKYYGIDAVGGRIWELLATPRTMAELVEQLAKEYEVESEECCRDVTEFLNYLCGEGLVSLD